MNTVGSGQHDMRYDSKSHLDTRHGWQLDRHLARAVKNIKTWQLLIILLIFIVLAVIFLRFNNLNMMNLRDELIRADQSGDVTKVETSAANLQHYVTQHMNTTTGQIPLQSLYDQAAQTALDQNRPPQINTDAYAQAQQTCSPQLSSYGYKAWAGCVANTVGMSNITDLNQNQVSPPDPDAYYVSFASARWSFDPAGITLLVAVILAIIIVVRLIGVLILMILARLRLRRQRL